MFYHHGLSCSGSIKYSQTLAWIWFMFSFSLLSSATTCIRTSRPMSHPSTDAPYRILQTLINYSYFSVNNFSYNYT